MVQQRIDFGLNDIDAAIQQGLSSIEIWTRFGIRQGYSLEDIVMHRRSILPSTRKNSPKNRAAILPLFPSMRPALGG